MSTSTGRPLRAERARRLPPDERRAAIVDATLPLVLQHGAAVSTRQIADAAGIAEGTIFRVFADKDVLMRAVVAKAVDPAQLVDELGAIDPGLPLRERLTAAAEIMRRRLAGLFNLFGMLGYTGPPEDRGDRDCEDRRRGSADDAVRAAMTELVGDDARLLRVAPTELAHLLHLLVFADTLPRVADRSPFTSAQLVGLLLDGVLAPDPACSHHTREDLSC